VVGSIKKSLKIYCNNEPAVQYFYNNKKSDAAKHINIKYYAVKEKIQDHTVSLEHISTKQILADPFIKVLPPNVFK
jgi:TfoX/Sxy family transcriptional regulator of competence genes